ncbi:MAG TPA: redoxin domain-containing protein [Deltaproteobacteria bacterium]|nr:redoxin domain-containing protein [Candidatus Binatota bacterium]HIL14457.1 redoxin domain-containing protein [Deltaproteobacteria bacterium]
MRRWEELRSEFDERDIQVVTVSAESPEDIQDRYRNHSLQAIMIADRDLVVTDAFGLRNLGAHSGPLTVDGLAVPTSLLIDGEGRVLWVDQAENYQRRNGPEVVLAALERHLD